MDNQESLIKKACGIFAREAIPYQGLGNKPFAFRKRKLAERVGAIDSPPVNFAAQPILVSKGERIYMVFRKYFSLNGAVRSAGQCSQGGKMPGVGNLAPTEIKSLQCIRLALVVGVQEHDKFPGGSGNAPIHGGVLAAIPLPEISNGKPLLR